MILFGIIGLIIISAAIWIKNEKRQNILFIAGGICLLFYSISIKDPVFSVLQVVFVGSALAELLRARR